MSPCVGGPGLPSLRSRASFSCPGHVCLLSAECLFVIPAPRCLPDWEVRLLGASSGGRLAGTRLCPLSHLEEAPFSHPIFCLCVLRPGVCRCHCCCVWRPWVSWYPWWCSLLAWGRGGLGTTCAVCPSLWTHASNCQTFSVQSPSVLRGNRWDQKCLSSLQTRVVQPWGACTLVCRLLGLCAKGHTATPVWNTHGLSSAWASWCPVRIPKPPWPAEFRVSC